MCDSGLLALSKKLRVLRGRKSGGHESSVAWKMAEALGSTCTEAWASGSHSSCSNHGGHKREGSRSPGVCLLAQASRSHGSCYRHVETKPLSSGSSRTCLSGMGFQEGGRVELQAWRNQTCWLGPSVTCGAVGALGPAYAGAQISLVF
jgi:hypothetical protein